MVVSISGKPTDSIFRVGEHNTNGTGYITIRKKRIYEIYKWPIPLERIFRLSIKCHHINILELNQHIQNCVRFSVLTMNMEAACSSEMLVPIYHTIQRRVSEDCNLNAENCVRGGFIITY
jgi:hypothetical protein